MKNSIEIEQVCGPSIAIVVPAHNEESTVRGVIKQIRTVCDHPIFLVDDASCDGTREAAREAGASVLRLSDRLGAWGATQTGLRYAFCQGYEFVVSLDADGQHNPASLTALLDPVLKGEVDVVIGSCPERASALRRIAWIMLRLCSGLTLNDITSGYRAYNKKALKVLSGWQASLLEYQDIGVILLLQSRGMTLLAVHTEMQERVSGPSRIFSSWSRVAYYMLGMLLLGASKRPMRRHQTPTKVI